MGGYIYIIYIINNNNIINSNMINNNMINNNIINFVFYS